MPVLDSNSTRDTQKIASDLAQKLKNQKSVIALTGELGAGKTTFTQGFAEGLGINDRIISPTFVLMRQHHFGQDQTLFHVDLYRLEENLSIKELGLKDIFRSKHDICLIEWAEKVKDQLPKDTIWINIEKLDGNSRKITIQM